MTPGTYALWVESVHRETQSISTLAPVPSALVNRSPSQLLLSSSAPSRGLALPACPLTPLPPHPHPPLPTLLPRHLLGGPMSRVTSLYHAAANAPSSALWLAAYSCGGWGGGGAGRGGQSRGVGQRQMGGTEERG